jgi:hypothetical protein
MSTASQTLTTMIDELPLEAQESLLEKIRPIISDMVDEYRWNRSYQKSSDKLEAFAKVVRQSSAISFDESRL